MTVSLDFTQRGYLLLGRLQAQTGLSRSMVIAVLIERHAHELTVDSEAGCTFKNKGQRVLTTRLPAPLATRFAEAKARTGKSYSHLGEALLTRWGPDEVFPAPPVSLKTQRKASAITSALEV